MKNKITKYSRWNSSRFFPILSIVWFFFISIVSIFIFAKPTFAKPINDQPQQYDQNWYLVEDYDSEANRWGDGWTVGNRWGDGWTSLPSSDPSKEFPYITDSRNTTVTRTTTTDMGKLLQQTNQGGSLLEKYLTLFGINYSDGNGKAITYIQVLINYALSLIWIVSVVLIMYSFYAIFFATKSEDAISKAKKTAIWASVALIIVGLSAYIVNFIFYLYNRWL